MIFSTRINGIPCQCEVLRYVPELPMRITGKGFGDADPQESAEFEYQILDRKGYKAPWLERYITDAVEDQLYEDFLIIKQAEYYGYYE